MPNLKTDRPIRLAGIEVALNVRRLIYQPLIWAELLRHQARGLRPALDAQRLEGEADALIDGVGGDAELDRDLLGREVLVDEYRPRLTSFSRFPTPDRRIVSRIRQF